MSKKNERVKISCPHCGKEFSVKPWQLGRDVRCSGCGEHVLLKLPEPTPGEYSAKEIPERKLPEPLAPPVLIPEEQTTEEKNEDDYLKIPRGSLKRKEQETAEIDMTPMVDIVFLLLIFFMVTASFAMQKSLRTPPPESDEKAAETMTVETLEDDTDNIIVRIDRDDTVWVEDEEAPTPQALIRLLQKYREPDDQGRQPNKILIFVDSQSHDRTSVMVLDAGNAIGMEGNVFMVTVDE